jgi:hypothetical protein
LLAARARKDFNRKVRRDGAKFTEKSHTEQLRLEAQMRAATKLLHFLIPPA